MNRGLSPGVRVRLHRPERGHRYAELVEEQWPRWMLRVSSGYELTLYDDEFDIED